MQIVRPSDIGELQAWLTARGEDLRERDARGAGAPILTGAAEVDVAAPVAAAPESRGDRADAVLSLSELDADFDLRPRDLSVFAPAGMRVAELSRRVEEAGLWMPLGPETLARSVGGAVSAAEPGGWDGAFGPIRRQLLACRVVDFEGRTLRWGRAVMKNVAGYDLPRLVAGSRGRLGVVAGATFRLWPKPGTIRAWRVDGEDARRGAAALAGHGADLAVEPDAASWSRGPEGQALHLLLAGSESSVAARAERLEAWAAAADVPLGEAPPELPAGLPRRADRLAFRVFTDRGYVAVILERLESELGDRIEGVRALPCLGTFRADLRMGASGESAGQNPGVAESVRRIGIVLAGVAGDEGARVRVRVERGPPGLHDVCRSLRSSHVRSLEDRIVHALGGRDRRWQADYL